MGRVVYLISGVGLSLKGCRGDVYSVNWELSVSSYSLPSVVIVACWGMVSVLGPDAARSLRTNVYGQQLEYGLAGQSSHLSETVSNF